MKDWMRGHYRTKSSPRWGLLVLFLAATGLTTSCASKSRNSIPTAKKGVLDLTKWNFERDGTVKLDGEWEFYWKKLLGPKEFSNPKKSKPSCWMKVPGKWRGLRLKGKSLPCYGHATYRLVVKLSDHHNFLGGIKVSGVVSAYKIWVNGTLLASIGRVGTNKTASQPHMIPMFFPLEGLTRQVELVLQVSHYHFSTSGGITSFGSIQLGTSNVIAQQQTYAAVLNAIPLGIVLIMSLYHFLLFILRPKNFSALVFGLFCADAALNITLTNEQLIYLFLPFFDGNHQVQDLTYWIGAVLLIWYFRFVFPQETSIRLIYMFSSFGALGVFLNTLISPSGFIIVQKLMQSFCLLCTFYVMYLIVAAIRKNRKGAGVVFVGACFFALSGLNDVLVTNYIYYFPYILPLGFLVMLFSQATLLAINFSNAYKRVEQLSNNLQQEVEKQTADLRDAKEQAEKAQEKLTQAFEQLAEHDRLKSRFFANVSHEIRTPLTLILAPLERMLNLKDKNTPLKDIEKQLTSMGANTQRLLRLVNQLLDFSRIETGKTSVRFELRNITTLIDFIVKEFEPFARSKEIKLELRYDHGLPDVYIDPEKFEKIFCNLLSNACKFTEPQGFIIVRLGLDLDHVLISVKDTGIGIAQEDLPKIFHRFHQVDSSASRRYEGTGIGLSLSNELAEQMGCLIKVDSELGCGSTFTIHIPLGKDHLQPSSMASEKTKTEPRTAFAKVAVGALEAEVGSRVNLAADLAHSDIQLINDSKKAKEEIPIKEDDRPLILIVEDNIDMRSLIKEICEDEFRIIEAGDGQEGLTLIHRHRPALVISDVMMPIMDGNELLGRIRSDASISTIPVLLLTAKAGPEMKIESLEQGADDYLAKPFESRELLARGRNLIRLQEKERQLKELNSKLHQEVIKQASELERVRSLQQYLPDKVAQKILEEGQATQLVQKRIRITVFRMELRGFKEILEEMDAEDITAVLNSYLSEMTKIAFDHGATVDKFIRDTALGFIGAPDTEGVKLDAVHCSIMAIALWKQANEVCERWRAIIPGEPPKPTIILASGYATVGNFGSDSRLEYTAVGGPVEDALDLLPHVKAGDVACSQSTWALIHSERPGTFIQEIIIPHRKTPVKLYQLAGGAENTKTERVYNPKDPIAEQTQSDVRALDVSGFENGQVLSQRYEVVRMIGEGGMSAVYQCKDLKLSIDVALKIIRADLDTDDNLKKRLYHEVKLARLVNHPNIARIFDLKEWQNYEFITMEYIEGQTLKQHLTHHGKLSLKEGQRILRQICSGLSAAHVAGVMHRDLKPSNIMLEPNNGRIVILDFGIAQWISHKQPEKIETKGISGTPLYMSPEQFEDEKLDQRTDIYSFGVLAFEIFTGRRPFTSESVATLAVKHVQEAPPHLLELRPDLPPRLAAVILRCLEKRPQDRFGSVREILGMLQMVSEKMKENDCII